MPVLDQFILFGDSITQGSHDQSKGFGLAAELQHAYVRRLDIINRGFSGYTSDHGLESIPRVFPTPQEAKVKFLTIWFGANDANKNIPMGQFVPADRFKANLIHMINHPVINAHSPNIILITTPPFEENVLEECRDAWGYTGPVRKAEDAREYAELVKEVGKEMGVPVVDIWSKMMEKAGWKEGEEVLPGSKQAGKSEVLAGMLPDGLHLSPDGYKIVFEGLIEVMREKWPEYPPYKMPFVNKVAWEIELGDQMWDVKNDD